MGRYLAVELGDEGVGTHPKMHDPTKRKRGQIFPFTDVTLMFLGGQREREGPVVYGFMSLSKLNRNSVLWPWKSM